MGVSFYTSYVQLNSTCGLQNERLSDIKKDKPVTIFQ